jgi:hypothetical protein
LTNSSITINGTSVSLGGTVTISTASNLDSLTDVTITTPTLGQVLKYNGSTWINDADATAGGAGAGTVTTVSVTSTNGFAGTVATASSTPAITISTSITGLLKGNGAAISAATAGTDYQAPIGTISGLVKGNGANALAAAVSGTDYAPGTSALATGIVKSTTTTGALTIAVAGTDYQAPISATGILKSSGVSGNVTAAVSGTDYQAPLPSQTGFSGKYLTTDGLGTLSWGTVSGLVSRTTVTTTTASLANNANANADITGYKSYALLKIQTSAAAWVRIYSDAASRTADASRASNIDPASGAGIITEVITSGAQTILISPGAFGFNNESSPTTTIPVNITNLSGLAAAITVTLTILQLES